MKNLYPVLLLCSLATGVLQAESPKTYTSDEITTNKQTQVNEYEISAIDLTKEIDDEHSSLDDKAPSLKAKFGSGLTVTSANESFSFQMRGRFQGLVQVGHMFNSDESAEFGAQVRRGRFKMAGHVGKAKQNEDDVIASKHKMKYAVQLGFTNRDITGIAEGSGVLLDAFLTYAPSKHLSIQVGQKKLPGNRQGVTSSQKQQFVDRGASSAFRLDRDFGIQFHGKFGEKFIFKPVFSVATGEGRNQVGLTSSGLDYTVRADFLPLGDFHKGKGDYVMADVDREPKPKLALGVTYDANHDARFSRGQRGGSEVAQKDRTTIHTVFADAIFKHKGLSIFGEYGHRVVGSDYLDAYTTGNALTTSIGYVCEKMFEVAFRYSRAMPLDNIKLDKDMRTGTNSYTIGASKYFKGHNLKIQTDYTLVDLVNGDLTTGLWRLQFEVAF